MGSKQCIHHRLMQALRLGNFLTETKPLKFLHRGDGEHASDTDVNAEPLVLKLGNYLNGASMPKPGDAETTPATDADHRSGEEDTAMALSMDEPAAERAEEGAALPTATSKSAPAAAVAEEPPTTAVVSTE